MSIHRLRLATVTMSAMTLPEGHPLAGQLCEVYAYLIAHPDGPILVDTGVGADHPAIEALYQPRVYSLDDALEGHGAAISDITAVVNTHLHYDHCGNNNRFPGVPIYVQRAEYEAAQQPLYTIPEWVEFPGATYELLDGEFEVAPGVRLMPTPGHTPGHQSIIVTTDDTTHLVCGQAAYNADEFLNGSDMGNAYLEQEYARSMETVRSVPASRIYFSHDENDAV